MDNMNNLGHEISGLSREEPPRDLVARTVSRVMALHKPVKKVFFMLRPITNPLARIAAAACIIFMLTPMTDIDQAAPIGSKIEEKVMGPELTDSVEVLVDDLLLSAGPASYQQSDLDAMMGVRRPIQSKHHRTAPRDSRIRA